MECPTFKPDVVIGSDSKPYMFRWYVLPRNRWLNIYLHKFLADDDDRALHDHPWPSMSIMLKGAALEMLPGCSRLIVAGDVVFRTAEHKHRLVVIDPPTWTLFITGSKVRDWGFWCPQGFVPWQKFSDPSDKYKVGKGCDQ